jgi:WD40 repeat protein
MLRVACTGCVGVVVALVGGGSLLQTGTPVFADERLPDVNKVSTTALVGHGKEIGSARFSRDGKLAATGCHDRKVRVFDIATGKELHAFDFGDAADNSPDRFGIRTQGSQEGLAFDHKDERLVAVGGGWLDPPVALVRVFDLTAKKAVFTSRAHKGMVHGAAFSGDGSLLVTAGHDSTLKVLEATTGKERGTFRGHGWVVTALTLSPDGKTVASACCNSEKRSIRLWDPKTLKESQDFPLPDRIFALNDLAFSPDGKHIAGVSNGRLHVWDLATGKVTANAVLDAGLFTRIAYSPDGKRIAVAGGQGGGDGKGILRVYDVSTDKVHLVFVDPDTGKDLFAVAWPRADTILAVGARRSDVKVVTVHLK